jgi:hypothetical protein
VALCGALLAVACGDGAIMLYDFTAHARISPIASFDAAADARASIALTYMQRAAHAATAVATATSTTAASAGSGVSPLNASKTAAAVKKAQAQAAASRPTATPTTGSQVVYRVALSHCTFSIDHNIGRFDDITGITESSTACSGGGGSSGSR